MIYMFPSLGVIGLGALVTAVLAIVDWYVWSTAPSRIATSNGPALYPIVRESEALNAGFKAVA